MAKASRKPAGSVRKKSPSRAAAKPAARRSAASRSAAGKKAAGERKARPAAALKASAKVPAKKKVTAKTVSKESTKVAARKSGLKAAQKKPVKVAAKRKTPGGAGAAAPAKKTALSRRSVAPKKTAAPRRSPSRPKKAAAPKPAAKQVVRKKKRAVPESDRFRGLRSMLIEKRNTILKEAKDEIAKYISGENRQLVDTAIDEGDWAVIDISEDISLRRLDSHRKLLRDIDECVRKIQDGTYGVCEECGEEISQKRLQVLPTATLCIDCKEAREKMEALEMVAE